MRVDRGLRVLGVVALVVAGATACGSSADDPAAGKGRTAAVYTSILDHLLADEPDVGTGEKPEWVLFVASRSEEQIHIDVQVAVVDTFESDIFVRFIDERAEAVIVDDEGEPVRDDGMLVGLGAVDDEGDQVEVYVDRYRNIGDVDAWIVTLRRAADTWEVVDTPVATDVRPSSTDS